MDDLETTLAVIAAPIYAQLLSEIKRTGMPVTDQAMEAIAAKSIEHAKLIWQASLNAARTTGC